MLRHFAVGAAAIIGLIGAAPGEFRVPSATMTIDETQFGFLLGGNVGGGSLQFGDRLYAFKIGGVSFGDIGASRVRGFGRVYNLNQVADFAGTYTKVNVSATLGSGWGLLRLRNKRGVVLELDTTSKGLQLSAGGGGVKITLRPPETQSIPAPPR